MPDRGEAAGFAGAFGDSQRSGSQEPCGSRWAGRGKLRTLSLFPPSDAGDGDDARKKERSARGSPSPEASEGVGLQRRDERALEAGADCKGIASPPTVLRAEMVSAEWHHYSEAPPPSSAPAAEGLPFRGFIVARRRVCRFSEKKESAGTREEKINSISGVSYRAQWATHNFSCLRQEEMDGDPPPALGGVRMWVVKGFSGRDGSENCCHGDSTGCSRGGAETLKMTMNSAHLEASVSRGTASIAFCSSHQRASPEARNEELSAGSRSSPPQSRYQWGRSSSPPGLATPGHKEKVLVQVEQGREPQLALGLQVEAASGDQGSISLDADVDFSAPVISVDYAACRRPSLSRMGGVSVEGAASDKPEKSKSEYPSCLVGDHPDADQEERSRWVKRLKVVRSGGHSGASALAGRREQRLCSRVMNYSRSNPFTLAKCLREQRQFQKTMLLLRSSDSLAAPPVDSHPWIRRWSRKSRLTPPPPGQEVERVEPLPEKLEGCPFPSLAAMALMGKAINNFRPCKFQRRGSSLVWNTEGL